ncbi:hypothetical protein MtrunA17_Chr3g0096601 [Medicago truncatula]|uniref:Uncharacterized protein n=1 Tax=Medicago truncatula TaxID=3880 RepID=A0A396IMU2_MEDTR|nr:hypothetical protein MtrunA17_Chr3g0096601 [Medicago truncatula]
MFAFDKVISSCCIRNLSTYLKGTPTVLLLQSKLWTLADFVNKHLLFP